MQTSTNQPELDQTQKAAGKAYLRFQLAPQMPTLLEMEYAQEVLVLPVQQLTPMPCMPESVLGLMNRRSRIFWLVDLAQMLGLPPLKTNVQQYNVAIVRAEPAYLGLAIQEIRGVARFPPEAQQAIQDPVAPGLAPYLQGMVLQPPEVLLVLNAAEIVHSSLLQNP